MNICAKSQDAAFCGIAEDNISRGKVSFPLPRLIFIFFLVNHGFVSKHGALHIKYVHDQKENPRQLLCRRIPLSFAYSVRLLTNPLQNV